MDSDNSNNHIKGYSMKKVLLGSAFAILASTASAQADFTVNLVITGGIQTGNALYDTIQVDLTSGSKFVAAHGVLLAGNLATPATGTCFFTISGGVMCNFQVDQNSYTMNLEPNLSGTITAKGPNGTIFASAPVFVSSVE